MKRSIKFNKKRKNVGLTDIFTYKSKYKKTRKKNNLSNSLVNYEKIIAPVKTKKTKNLFTS